MNSLTERQFLVFFTPGTGVKYFLMGSYTRVVSQTSGICCRVYQTKKPLRLERLFG